MVKLPDISVFFQASLIWYRLRLVQDIPPIETMTLNILGKPDIFVHTSFTSCLNRSRSDQFTVTFR